MRIRTQLALVLLTNLAACETKLNLLIINDTGQVVVASVESTTRKIDIGQSARLDYPSLASGDFLRIIVRGCELRYHLPLTRDSYPWPSQVNGTIPLQLEANMNLYALPPELKSSIPFSTAAAIQGGRYPLKPENPTLCANYPNRAEGLIGKHDE